MGIAAKAPDPAKDIEPNHELDLVHGQGHAPVEPAEETVGRMADTLEPGDAEQLATLLRAHPNMRDVILQHAQASAGNATVEQAIALLDGTGGPPGMTPSSAAPAGAGHAPDRLSQVLASVSTIETGDSRSLAMLVTSNPDLRQQILERAQDLLGEDTVMGAVAMIDVPPPAAPAPTPEDAAAEKGPAPEPEPEPAKESPWIVRARAYNDAHFGDTEEFNALTNFMCVVDGLIDPNLIARWQEQNGLHPDGRIGAHTLERARELAKQTPGLPQSAADPLSDELRDAVEKA
jgi:hypothetical protein